MGVGVGVGDGLGEGCGVGLGRGPKLTWMCEIPLQMLPMCPGLLVTVTVGVPMPCTSKQGVPFTEIVVLLLVR